MVTTPSDLLQMGTAAAPVPANVTARLVIDDRNNGFGTADATHPDYDPLKLGNGLISHGRVEPYGAAKTEYGTTSGALTGETVINLDRAPAGWNPGDTLILADADANGEADEVAMVASVNGSAVTLTQPLTRNHTTPTHNKADLELKVHMANATRSVVIETADENRAATSGVRVKRRRAPLFESRGGTDLLRRPAPAMRASTPS